MPGPFLPPSTLIAYVCFDQAAVIWLLALVKKCGFHRALQGKLSEIQAGFMSMLSENDGKM